MTKQIFKNTLKEFAFIVFMVAMICCNSNKKADAKVSSAAISENESIPDSIVKFLIISASNDFLNHQPPKPIDFRNVKIGYIESPNSVKTFVLCGEFLSQENKDWKEFTTIKTSGYEQYLGKTQYCQDAKMVLTDENLSVELKKKLTEK
ncbi:hypothetical protein [Dyadobacter sp. CY356]|uniref:hypothetical protein n=1 Tax=Dyadobacter sp. CY356 TaxID=2906442 RepID=UPI001F369164|nr:hypothetical protein [Dyadobacter sp. CY356]MCF0056349.1 hypothetical protein [Dyadobacter sp. CY356]